MSVIEFPDPSKPDPQFVKKDDYGRAMYQYGGSYEFDGKNWAVDIWAYSMDDAQNRFKAMKKSIRLDGQLMGVVEG